MGIDQRIKFVLPSRSTTDSLEWQRDNRIIRKQAFSLWPWKNNQAIQLR